MIDRAYTEYNPQAKYFLYLFLSVPDSWIDFNLAKDKREVRVQNRDKVERLINKSVTDYLIGKQEAKQFDRTDGIKQRYSEKLATQFQIEHQHIQDFYSKQTPQLIDLNETKNNDQTQNDVVYSRSDFFKKERRLTESGFSRLGVKTDVKESYFNPKTSFAGNNQKSSIARPSNSEVEEVSKTTHLQDKIGQDFETKQ